MSPAPPQVAEERRDRDRDRERRTTPSDIVTHENCRLSVWQLYFPPNQLETPDLASLALASTFLSNSSTFFSACSLVSFA